MNVCFFIPERQKSAMGQANVWYADSREANEEIRNDILSYIATGTLPLSRRRNQHRTPHQSDPAKRRLVEDAAIKVTTDHFANLDYELTTVEKDNVGWDLEARLDNRLLRLEVKGLSGPNVAIELTPNEYAKMQENKTTYQICTVTSALTAPDLKIFSFNNESDHWESDDGRALEINEVISAKCSC